MVTNVPFNESLASENLVLDMTYEGGNTGNLGDDPISKLLPGVGNQRGFRPKAKSLAKARIIALVMSGKEVAWPNTLDPFSGLLTYFGDNRKPGVELDVPYGNRLLLEMFTAAWDGKRDVIPPLLVFEKTGVGRNVMFRGLAVPGAKGIAKGDDLVAVWRSSNGARFQNYRALFTILDVNRVDREWLTEVKQGVDSAKNAPQAWRSWVQTGTYTPLISKRIGTRSKSEQLPATEADLSLLKALHATFANDPYAFEACAVEIWRLLAENTGEVNLTRPWRDGGRDALGTYLFGPPSDRLPVEFALEAKCYQASNSVGVKEMSRLIARLRHRQFGVFVTTSYFNPQAYKEVRDDQHPVVLISGRDIVDALHKGGVTDQQTLRAWLRHSKLAQ